VNLNARAFVESLVHLGVVVIGVGDPGRRRQRVVITAARYELAFFSEFAVLGT